jgi:multimeric flavodoxin WrbA
MKIVVINGSPKPGGFTAGALDIISERLVSRGAQVRAFRIADQRIGECTGCFTCLNTGVCTQRDDMDEIVPAMLEADGIVVGSPVRNGLTTSTYKRFLERITYVVGFPLLLDGKQTLVISSVGYAGGRGVSRTHLGLGSMYARLSGFLFFRTGIPGKLKPGDVRARLERAVDTLLADISAGTSRSVWTRCVDAINRFAMRKLMFEKTPDLYAHVIRCWRSKGYMR